MKEYLENEGVCFGVDCIRSYSAIKKLTQSSIQACDQLLQVVKTRIKAEETHATSLAGISEMPLTYSPGSLQDCMEQLQSDTRHKANQHQILADSLKQEVIKPISALKDQMAKKEASLCSQYTNMNNELKRLEECFKKKSASYEKAYLNALSNISNCRKNGILNEEYEQLTRNAMDEPQSNMGLATTWNSLTSLTSSTNLLATKEKGKDWLNWAVASASGTPTGSRVQSSSAMSTPLDKKSFCELTMKALQKLEKYRTEARQAWLEFIVLSQRYAIKTQILLTKLQGMQESFILILQDHLRKIIVVESSFLANQQYDIQMLFKVMEDIDVREDMRQFILKNAATPLDLYESDADENEDNDELESVGRSKSASSDGEDNDVEIVVDEIGKPLVSKTRKTKSSPDKDDMKALWSSSPWTSDIFGASSKLSHIKELPLPPCGDSMTFSSLRSILIEKHLDEKDKRSKSPLQNHQYEPVEKVHNISRISLVSRHIDRHNILVGGGKTASTLAQLEIATASNKKRLNKSNGSASEKSPSSTVVTICENCNDPLTIDTPLSKFESPAKNETRSEGYDSGDDGVNEELMSYGCAEEALEKMVLLQTKMRQHWASLIEEFSEKGKEAGNINGKIADNCASTQNERLDLSRGVDEEKGGSSSSSTQALPESINQHEDTTLSNNNQSSESLDQLIETDSGMIGLCLKDSDKQQERNMDSAKCREIINSFGLLDAVSVDVEDDWHGRSTKPINSSDSISSDKFLDADLSPLSVKDLNISTPVNGNGFNQFRHSGKSECKSLMDLMPTNRSDNSDFSVEINISDSGQAIVGNGAANISKNYFASATPESLDFLST